MKDRNRYVTGVLAALGMLVVILDGKTAQHSVVEGLALCIKTVIPALFPFLILSGMLNSTLLGNRSKILDGIENFCGLPQGSGSVLLIGFLSGYPVGAQLVGQAYTDGCLTRSSARRMLGFCSNAGPAFIFGMLSPLFQNPITPWLLWGIHIGGAVFASKILTTQGDLSCRIDKTPTRSLSMSLQNAMRLMVTVCGWVILFRLLLGFFDKWFLWLLPKNIQIITAGLVELSNGCVQLSKLPQEGLRFLFASVLLGAGGLCVAMQTCSVTQGLGMGVYFPGKVLQTLFSAVVSYILQPLLFSQEQRVILPVSVFVLFPLIAVFVFTFFFFRKKVVAFSGRMLYNTDNHMR